jgi:hypothetical protein
MHGGNQLVRIAGGKMDRADDRVMALDGRGKSCDVWYLFATSYPIGLQV